MAKADTKKGSSKKEEKNDASDKTKADKIKSEKKEKPSKAKKNAEVKKAKKDTEDAESDKPEMMKKEASAKEIDITQSKRLVKIKHKPKAPAKKTRKVVRAVKLVIKARDIGVDIEPPEDSCQDPFCTFHGTVSVRGQIINGVVMSSKMDKSAIIQREIKRFIPKYERYEKRTHRYAVHNPPCLNVQRGDLVKIMECRPLSKSKSFVVIEKM